MLVSAAVAVAAQNAADATAANTTSLPTPNVPDDCLLVSLRSIFLSFP
jgi:hypothetical protein